MTTEPERDPAKAFVAAVGQELEIARLSHAPINSLHEGYAVILEECDELWAEVKKRSRDRNPGRIYAELVQIAAMAQRMAEDVVERMWEGEAV